MKIKTEEEKIEEFRIEIEGAKLNDISCDLQMEYLLMDDYNSEGSEIMNNLDIANDAIQTAISKYGIMLKVKTEVNCLSAEHRKLYNNIQSLKNLAGERRSISNRITNVIENIEELGHVYKSFIKFGLNDIKKLSEIVTDPGISWGSVHVARRIELIQTFTDRLMPCIDLLKECDILQSMALNALTEIGGIFNSFAKENSMNFGTFLKMFDEVLKNHKIMTTKKSFHHKIYLLLNKIRKIPVDDLDIYNKRQKFNEIQDENSFVEVLNHWKDKAYAGELEIYSLEGIPNEIESRKRKIIELSVSSMLRNIYKLNLIELFFSLTIRIMTAQLKIRMRNK